MNEYYSKGRLWRLCQKELRESLRDRRTLFTLILMPILVYPLLSMALQRLVISSAGKSKAEPELVIGVEDEDVLVKIRELFSEATKIVEGGFVSPILIERAADAANATPLQASSKSEDDQFPAFDIVTASKDALARGLRDGDVDLLITELKFETTQLDRGTAVSFEIQSQFRQNDVRSEKALSQMRRAIQVINDYQSDAGRRCRHPMRECRLRWHSRQPVLPSKRIYPPRSRG